MINQSTQLLIYQRRRGEERKEKKKEKKEILKGKIFANEREYIIQKKENLHKGGKLK